MDYSPGDVLQRGSEYWVVLVVHPNDPHDLYVAPLYRHTAPWLVIDGWMITEHAQFAEYVLLEAFADWSESGNAPSMGIGADVVAHLAEDDYQCPAYGECIAQLLYEKMRAHPTRTWQAPSL